MSRRGGHMAAANRGCVDRNASRNTATYQATPQPATGSPRKSASSEAWTVSQEPLPQTISP